MCSLKVRLIFSVKVTSISSVVSLHLREPWLAFESGDKLKWVFRTFTWGNLCIALGTVPGSGEMLLHSDITLCLKQDSNVGPVFLKTILSSGLLAFLVFFFPAKKIANS